MQRQLTRKKIKLKSIKMAYYDEGAGTPIILLHGFPDSADVWRNIAPILIKDGYPRSARLRRIRGADCLRKL